MSQLNVYLTFNGNAREAMEFYHQCLGGEIEISTFGDFPSDESMSDEMKQKVMHARLTSGDLLLMASDTGNGHPRVSTGTSVTLSLNCLSVSEIKNSFSKLTVGGTITMPLADQFWGAKFGMFTDKFGMHWMMNYDYPKAQ